MGDDGELEASGVHLLRWPVQHGSRHGIVPTHHRLSGMFLLFNHGVTRGEVRGSDQHAVFLQEKRKYATRNTPLAQVMPELVQDYLTLTRTWVFMTGR